MFTVDWSNNQPTGKVIYRGFATLARLSRTFPKTEILLRGQELPGTRLKHLQTDNYGIRFDDLFTYPPDLYNLLLQHKPFPKITDDYLNPRTGKTTLEVLTDRRE